MVRGQEIARLVHLFQNRHVSLFHACQLLDFQSYLKIGGIPSHACLEKAHLPFTPLETDTIDKQNAVWDKVFVNLADFGKTFAEGGKGVPNPYGPILIQLHPAALLKANDIAICLKSGGAPNFDREKEAFKSIEDIDKLFAYPAEKGYPASCFTKFRKDLSIDFHYPGAADPEISCAVTDGFLSFQHVENIIVDPYIIREKPLLVWTHLEVMPFIDRMNLPICERTSYRPAWQKRKKLYNEFASIIHTNIPSLRELSLTPQITSEIRMLADTLINLSLEYQFRRFAKYLAYGTLKYLQDK